ncbi:MAG TPA: BlaI/MecI/CopY family transcriptional regulator [Caulobacteraceae bacterium]|jgi:predicted transcriptional regulator|nr:BlaI/MecI/CopY family transcriptional regulator [Caulobacteraceae bacterium]
MNITQAESRIMDALWVKSPLTADEVVAAVAGPQGWGEATVKTLINRLLKRKAIRSERIDGRVRYVPLLQRADYVQAESQGLLDRLFEGRLTPLVAHFAEHRTLKPDEIRRLRKLLDALDDDG